ncbi:MAG: hypothetical protein HOP15_10975 [Planctomycetes bacterium]|nr:hypothetical protein [Planctomycetota bacterium]
MNPPDDKRREREERASEIEHVRELLARTVRFLTRCSEDPKSALSSDDPRELIRGLQSLGVAPEVAAATGPRPIGTEDGADVESDVEAPTPIVLRRRRSA